MRILDAARFALTKALGRALLYFVAIFLVLAIPTALLSTPIIDYVRMIPATPLDYAFLFATSLLSAVYLAIPKSECAENGKALGGGLAGFLAVSCPICNKLLVLIFGFDFAFGVLEPARPFLGILSIALLAYAIDKKWKAYEAGGGGEKASENPGIPEKRRGR